MYLHCAALREVDTTLLVDSVLQRGMPDPIQSLAWTFHLSHARELSFVLGSAGDARCYVPLVLDQAANMRLLHLGVVIHMLSHDCP